MSERHSIDEELEVLRGIFSEELTDERTSGLCVVRAHLCPQTGEVEEEQFVFLDVVFTLQCKTYPHTKPEVSFGKWRGLSESHLQVIRRELEDTMESLLGAHMLFALISCVREQLTEHNRPHEDCAVCQSPFEGRGADFVRTECFHYFHRPCMWRWLKCVEEGRERAKEEACRNRVRLREDQLPQFECPVCREALQFAEEWLQWEDIPKLEKGCDHKEEGQFQADAELRQWQRKMAALRKRQDEKGGIIDVERDKKLLLIGTADARPA